MTSDDLAELRRLVQMLDDLRSEPDEFIAVDTRFHLKVAHMARNPMLVQLVETFWNGFLLARAHYPVGHVDLEEALRNQRNTLAALESRDPRQIVKAMDQHLASSEEHFLGERLSFPDLA